MHPKTIQKLIDLFSKFPTVGPRTASRFVFYLMRLSKDEIQDLMIAISKLRDSVKICRSCFNPFENESELCQICRNPLRDKALLCIAANETDLTAIEKTKKYKGLYFVLGGTVSMLKKASAEGNLMRFTPLDSAEGNLTGLRIKELENIIKNRPEIQEIILAMNANTEGEATALYLERVLKSLAAAQGKKITRLGRGLPLGGELEYADQETLSSALDNRK